VGLFVFSIAGLILVWCYERSKASIKNWLAPCHDRATRRGLYAGFSGFRA
jgi:hypothetical protein